MNRSRTIVVLLVIILQSFPLIGGEMTYHIRQQDSLFGFEIYKWLVFKEEGRFREFAGTITYDPDRPERTSVNITIEVASVDSRDTDRDQVIRGEEYFYAARYPRLTFRSTSARRGGMDTLLVAGELTMRGISRQIEVPVRVMGVQDGPDGLGGIAGFEASFVIRRTDFNIAPRTNMLSNEVTIKLIVGASTKRA
jgi:polyisoprenoid-binding protein YceI